MPARKSRKAATPASKRASRRDLAEYDRKRNFERTSEPASHAAADLGPLTFVVQKHDASRLHYDLRLEAGGALVSWAVPNGPSYDPGEKRLAVHVEDHPLDYASFEGVIPGGQYGAGEDLVWDNGTYSPDEDEEGGRAAFSFHDRAEAESRLLAGLAAGKISVRLRGSKLKGSWALVKTQQDEKSWLLIKHRDAFSSTTVDVLAEDASVLRGLTIEDLQSGAGLGPISGLATPNPLDLEKAVSAALARNTPTPMQAVSREEPFHKPGWLYEPKLDGIRLVAMIRHGDVDLRSRNGQDLTAQYPSVVRALASQPVATAIVDGEVVAATPAGVPSFERLQQRMNLVAESKVEQAEIDYPVAYYAFDLLHVDGVKIERAPLWQRKEMLRRVLDFGEVVRLVEPIASDGREVFRALVASGLEGMVAKRRDSPYLPGKRSPSWLKIKAQQTADFVIGGFTPGQGRRASTFGALLLGEYDADGKLQYAGRVGSGFRDAQLEEYRALLEARRRKRSPFAAPVPDTQGETYVRPDLVAEVEFAERTSAGQLRAPVFQRLRPDKAAREVLQPGADESSAATTPGADFSGRGVDALLAQLESGGAALTLAVDGEPLPLSNLGKEMWPAYEDAPPVTKRDLLRFLIRLAPQILSQLRDRPLTLTRYPNGITGKMFYQKQWDQPRPSFVETVSIYSEENEGAGEYLLCNNLGTLLWLGQIADLGFHAALARVTPGPDTINQSTEFAASRAAVIDSVLNYPDFLLFDLDPFVPAEGETASVKNTLTREGFAKSAQVAKWLKSTLDSIGLRAFVKTSGSSGLHIFVPIVRNLDYVAARAAQETVAKLVVAAHPRDVSIDRGTRAGKVYIDLNQLGRTRALAAAWSPRAKPGAPVSMPLRWEEVGEVDPLAFTIWTAEQRLRRSGDPWAGILEAKQDIRALLG